MEDTVLGFNRCLQMVSFKIKVWVTYNSLFVQWDLSFSGWRETLLSWLYITIRTTNPGRFPLVQVSGGAVQRPQDLHGLIVGGHGL